MLVDLPAEAGRTSNYTEKKLKEAERHIKELEDKLSAMTHAAKELHGTVIEYCDMPCKSLEKRMFQTAGRYKKRIFDNKEQK